MKFRIIIIALVFHIGCTSYDPNNVMGLWQLEGVEVDGINRPSFNPTFMRLKSDNTFAAIRTSGDLVGVFDINAERLQLHSEDRGWFNKNWSTIYQEENLHLRGLDYGYRTTKLKFKKIDRIPNFEEFQKNIVGQWQLYKTKRESTVEVISDTWLDIDEEGYTLRNSEGIQDTGKIAINPRRQEIVFVRDNTLWKVWFFGDELRLDSEELNLQYRLRKE